MEGSAGAWEDNGTNKTAAMTSEGLKSKVLDCWRGSVTMQVGYIGWKLGIYKVVRSYVKRTFLHRLSVVIYKSLIFGSRA